jgi:DNA-binding HxlR family transcriptional regulator
MHLLDHTVSLLARKWTLHIARALNNETKRHSELARSLPGITQKVLTETLREMERAGIVERTIHPTIPPKVEYRLTMIGLGLLRVSSEFAAWFDMHHDDIRRAKKLFDNQR